MLKYFVDAVQEQDLNVDSIIITKDGKRYEHYFTDNKENNIRSISKTISCLGAYKAIEKKLFTLETNILPFFDETKITNVSNLDYLSKMKVKHLLNLTIGQSKGLMFSKDIHKLSIDTDLLYYVLNFNIDYAPGTHFVYNNAATYLLCAIIQQLTGEYFGDWVQKELFNAMEITTGNWESSWQGICLGASGLRMTNKDLHEIALLLLNDGCFNKKQIISKEWVDLMHTPHFFTANLPDYVNKQGRCINKMSYGYGLWICGNGTKDYPKTHYFCDGTDGQLIIISPDSNMAISILSHQSDMNPLYEILNYYL
ncbi:MAG: serine hydrolase [Ruminococcus flavefaciens]|nr:serine hydrolase [Ruminococcus flavefaciens]MCM1061105.1 serine hydrolase [Eubacterium sp.]